MTTLADLAFEQLQAGMCFHHPKHGLQVILDLGRGQFGPTLLFHACDVFSGRLPVVDADAGDDEAEDIFHALARSLYPAGASEWEYRGKLANNEVAVRGWSWFRVACPHCGLSHHFLSAQVPSAARSCRGCGMVFSRPATPETPEDQPA